ncbi:MULTISPECIES: GNAT family N-acetyltransferase [Pantoea]|jgi:RimJ/RimL family protein N-acetyltransferase|uniref:GNAT family N-acetyltransferase n=3 Tax=Gammaproteobacteria TaxID=1236 RepID=A0A6B3JEA8_ENTAG|nr:MULTISPECIES: GNAT family N-acetyltransferase [Pantoea]AOE38674.1 GNAT family N-acetyltransferase [Pantoea agglomerans]AYP22489.1 N-acetyltransferase [Pantoea agglomerans]AZI51818.1 N-acetyltransferase [Pantoea agglomerans]KAF6676044.1 GNAT family N-acetyltransferase [Pantoea sp. EKM21T]KAF6680899.1 GNAT family N-acetyltransferase [Pantoea sp. EKM22T]
MQLVTARLTLSKLQPEDWQLFRAVHEDRDTMTWVSEVPDEADIRQRFTERLAPWQASSFHMLCLVARRRDNGEPIGLFGCSPEWEPYRQAEVGYMLLHRHCGQGYGSEALAALCQFLLEADFHKLKAMVIEGNWASRRILEKNGFQLEGTLRDNYLLNGCWVNDWLLGRLNPQK